MNPTDWIWQNGELKKWPDATVHCMAHGLHYGSTVFEGLRSYSTDLGPAIFRLREHIDRLYSSCKIYRIEIPYSRQQIEDACQQVVEENGLTDAYIRPLVYRDFGSMGLVPNAEDPIGVVIGAIEWGPLLGKESLEKGTDICVSSWHRLQSSSTPVMSKAGGHYLTSQLISTEAVRNGYAEGIAVNQSGIVTEGAGANLFIVRNGKIYTPSLGCSILEGITRDTILWMARDENLDVVEADLPRESLYLADEVFLCGTALEVTPVSTIDRITIGSGKPGEITRRLQSKYTEIVRGRAGAKYNWLTYCKTPTQVETADRKQSESTETLV